MAKKISSAEYARLRHRKVLSAACEHLHHWARIAPVRLATDEDLHKLWKSVFVDKPEVKKLPRFDRAYLEAVWDGYHHRVYSCLTWTVVHPTLSGGRRVWCKDKCLDGHARELCECLETTTGFAYAVMLGTRDGVQTLFIPYVAKERQADLDAGRLTQAQIDAAAWPKSHHARVTFLSSSVHPHALTPVDVEYWT